MADGDQPWRLVDGGAALKIRVTPKGGRDAVDGVSRLGDGEAVLKIRVRAAPEDGAANKAVIALLAGILDLPRSRITIEGGATMRTKTIFLAGNGPELGERLAALIA